MQVLAAFMSCAMVCTDHLMAPSTSKALNSIGELRSNYSSVPKPYSPNSLETHALKGQN